MYSIPSEILNEIAKTQQLRSQWAKRIFSMSEDQKNEELDKEAEAALAKGMPLSVVLNYQTFAPLLMENEAISKYVLAKNDPGLRAILPELTTVREATIAAKQKADDTSSDLATEQDLEETRRR